MKIKYLSLLLTLGFNTALFAEEDHKGHDHKEHAHSEEKHKHEGHDCEDEHVHDAEAASPNNGKILKELEPHVELVVTEDNKLQIFILGEDGKVVAPNGESFSAIAGERQSPTSMKFEAKEGSFISDVTLPDGKNFPIILSFKAEKDGEKQRAKFNLNLNECPTCDFKEYACICDHGDEGGKEDDHSDHNH